MELLSRGTTIGLTMPVITYIYICCLTTWYCVGMTRFEFIIGIEELDSTVQCGYDFMQHFTSAESERGFYFVICLYDIHSCQL